MSPSSFANGKSKKPYLILSFTDFYILNDGSFKSGRSDDQGVNSYSSGESIYVVLKKVALVMETVCSDSTVARWGGEEFLILSLTGPELIEKLRDESWTSLMPALPVNNPSIIQLNFHWSLISVRFAPESIL